MARRSAEISARADNTLKKPMTPRNQPATRTSTNSTASCSMKLFPLRLAPVHDGTRNRHHQILRALFRGAPAAIPNSPDPVFCCRHPSLFSVSLARNRTQPGSGRAYRGGGDRTQQMVPVLEYDIDRDRAHMFEEPVGRPTCDDSLAPGQHGQSGGGMERESEQIQNHQDR